MKQWDRRISEWVELIVELTRCPGTMGMPREAILTELGSSFEGLASWNEVRPDGTLVFDAPRWPQAWPGGDEYEWWRRNGPSVHPLIGWYATGQDMAAMTLRRVPMSVVSQRARGEALERLSQFGIDEQLSIPCSGGPSGSWAFVMARTGDDFSDEDLRLARAVQPLLMLLARQVQVQACSGRDPLDLTAREGAVLALLCEGKTAMEIGHGLGMSVRTVDKHLERIYRKLGVHDRLAAYQVAVQARFVEPPHGGATGNGGTN